MSLTLRGQEALMADLAGAMGASDIAIERFNNFVLRSTAAQAQSSIRSGAKSGKIYRRKDPDRVVQASAPGESPADDLGYLANSITFRLFSTTSMVGIVEVGAYYAEDLEFGTAKIAPRPFLYPAFREALARADGKLKAEFVRNL